MKYVSGFMIGMSVALFMAASYLRFDDAGQTSAMVGCLVFVFGAVAAGIAETD